MPYLEGSNWTDGEVTWPAGSWVPDQRRTDWRARGGVESAWRRREGLLDDERRTLEEFSEGERDYFLANLGADIGAAQREGYFYNNLAEQLKDFAFSHSDPESDELADRLIDRLGDWGFASTEWQETQGGPPHPRSPRGWRRVLSWFLDKAAQVGEFLINAIDAFIHLCSGVAGASAVSVEVSMPPGIGVEFDVEKLIGSGQGIGPLRQFAQAMFRELRKSPFN